MELTDSIICYRLDDRLITVTIVPMAVDTEATMRQVALAWIAELKRRKPSSFQDRVSNLQTEKVNIAEGFYSYTPSRVMDGD